MPSKAIELEPSVNTATENIAQIMSESSVVGIDHTRYIVGEARIADAKVRFTLKEPAEVVDDTGVIVINGYGGIKEAYTDLDNTFAENGRRSASFYPIRQQGIRGTFSPRHLLHPLRAHAQGAWGVMRLLADEHGIERFDIVAHSLGGEAGTSVAETHPLAVRNLILLASAGLDHHSTAVLAQRLPGFITQELIPGLPELRARHGSAVALKELQYFLKNPFRSGAEALAVSNCNILPSLYGLRETSVGTAAIQFANDHLFPLEGVERHAKTAVNIFAVYDDPDAGHMAPQLDPEGVAEASLLMIEQLEAFKKYQEIQTA